ncbi:LysR family transcriptional regulator [Pseudoponticoccus marisrubri]|uniref:Transcriptional regulator n=1 Tax=Pseudoponticoccus marisrubri TaxID=1685382 RepID=A0A0W7WFU2_9RHOB|nr:LysR family transcriptional regulator [Pseudoponticoccus marisrubri]KUF09335.1 transcriptional regulator [Pseudoponticoccus marisrubri]
MSLAHRVKPSHLGLLLKIAETQRLQMAAEAMAITQPAASRILSEIEGQTGMALFQRHPRGMIPTEAGEAFLKHARGILSEFDSLTTELRQLRDGEAGSVRVGSVSGPAVGVLVPALRAVRAKALTLSVSIGVAPSHKLIRGLEEGRYDFIIARLPSEGDARSFRSHPARVETVALLARDGHPLAGRPVGLSELTGAEWVIQDPGSPIRRAVEDACIARSLPVPRRVTDTSSLLVALALMSGSDAVSPQTQETASLLTGPGIGARLVQLQLDTRITVSPYFVIESPIRQRTSAVERMLEAVLTRL